MKKLLTFVSAITAGAIGTAAAEVSVSGGGNFYYSTASGDTVEATQEDSNVSNWWICCIRNVNRDN